MCWTGGGAVVAGRTGAGRLLCGVLGTGAATGAVVVAGGATVLGLADGTTAVDGEDGTAALEVAGAALEAGVVTVARWSAEVVDGLDPPVASATATNVAVAAVSPHFTPRAQGWRRHIRKSPTGKNITSNNRVPQVRRYQGSGPGRTGGGRQPAGAGGHPGGGLKRCSSSVISLWFLTPPISPGAGRLDTESVRVGTHRVRQNREVGQNAYPCYPLQTIIDFPERYRHFPI